MKKVLSIILVMLLTLGALAANQVAQKTFVIHVVEGLAITNVSLPDIIVGQPYSAQLVAVGGVLPYEWSVDNTATLPPGLTLNPNTGAITGTVTSLPVNCTVGQPCNVNVLIRVKDSTP